MRKRRIERSPFVAPDGYLTRKDAMEFLGISNGTIYHWEIWGLLHPLRIGGYTVYPKDELEQLKKNCK